MQLHIRFPLLPLLNSVRNLAGLRDHQLDTASHQLLIIEHGVVAVELGLVLYCRIILAADIVTLLLASTFPHNSLDVFPILDFLDDTK